MRYHERAVTQASERTLVILLSVLTFLLAGAGLGVWLGQYATVRAVLESDPHAATHPPFGLPRFALLPAEGVARPPAGDAGQRLVARLGQMRAELTRLNALGERLVDMAGLDPAEFDFAAPPALGGPETVPVRDYTIKEIASELGGLVSLIQDRRRKLDRLDETLGDRPLTAPQARPGWPVATGYISSAFGFRVHPIKRMRAFHEGVDIATARGTPIHAVADGVVTFSGRQRGYGNLIDLRHASGMVTRYAHNAANLVREGERVRQGQKIATVGATGSATGPHVHFEVHRNGRPVDPMPYLDDGIPRQILAGKPAPAPAPG